MTIELTIFISIASLLIATLTFITNFNRNSKHDTTAEVEERASMNARLLTKLDGISDDLKEIKRDNLDMHKEMTQLSERVLILEQTAERRSNG